MHLVFLLFVVTCQTHQNSLLLSATIQRAPVRYETTRKLHLLTQHELHGTVTGLAGLRTINSSVDGLDRLLVSFKDAKVRTQLGGTRHKQTNNQSQLTTQ